MPNHITNVITISHDDKKQMKWLMGAFTEDTFDFNYFIPYPQKFIDLDNAREKWDKENPDGKWEDKPKDGFNSGGYEWCCARWGTKWGAYCVEIEKVTEKYIAVKFETAWSPPEPIFDYLEEKGFTVNGYWKDEGCLDIQDIGHDTDWYAEVKFYFEPWDELEEIPLPKKEKDNVRT